MKPTKLNVVRIGNSRGVRLPAATLRRYRIGEEVHMEQRSDGILLRPIESTAPRLSWSDTARAMAEAREDWSAWDSTASDGLEYAPWETKAQKQVAEPKTRYHVRARRANKK